MLIILFLNDTLLKMLLPHLFLNIALLYHLFIIPQLLSRLIYNLTLLHPFLETQRSFNINYLLLFCCFHSSVLYFPASLACLLWPFLQPSFWLMSLSSETKFPIFSLFSVCCCCLYCYCYCYYHHHYCLMCTVHYYYFWHLHLKPHIMCGFNFYLSMNMS